MKTPQKRIFLLACLGLTVATITFAGKIDVPSPPGRPSACDINVNVGLYYIIIGKLIFGVSLKYPPS